MNRTRHIALTLALAVSTAVVATSGVAATTALADGGCGIHVLTSPLGEAGEVLDITSDGIYAGSSGPAYQEQGWRPTWWVDGAAHLAPAELGDGWIGDVNEQHVAVATARPDGDEQGYVIDLDTATVTVLPGLDGGPTRARRINEHGVVAGEGRTRDGKFVPLIWEPPYAAPTRVARGAEQAYLQGIFDDGHLVGAVVRNPLTPDRRDYGGIDARNHWREQLPASWNDGHRPKALPMDGSGGQANAVNEAGTIVGIADVRSRQTHLPAVWNGGSPEILDLPGALAGAAWGLTDEGWVTGHLTMPAPEPYFWLDHAFVWTGSGAPQLLPSMLGSWELGASLSHAISTVRDEVGGKSISPVDFIWRPTVWSCASQIGEDV